jgi:hypothetical protein
MTVFPQNLLLWMLVGIAVVLLTGSFPPPTEHADAGADFEGRTPGLWRPQREPMVVAPAQTRARFRRPEREPGRRF